MMSRMIGRCAKKKMMASRTPVPQIAARVCSSFSNIAVTRDHQLEHRACVPATLRTEVPVPAHPRTFANPGFDLYRVDPRRTRVDPAAIDVTHLPVRRDVEPVQPEPDSIRDISPPD